MANIAVIGAGYVGLPTAACLAHLGHAVTCVDTDHERVRRLRAGDSVLAEAGLDELIAEGRANGRLEFDTDASAAVGAAEFVLLCLPTPPLPDGLPDISVVSDTARDLAPRLRPDALVVTKSTMPVGSASLLQRVLLEAGTPPGVVVVANPEFLREGVAVNDFLHPTRVVIGAPEEPVASRVAALYENVDAPLVVTDCESAEMIKYAANAFLATKVSYVNELANACEALGADIEDVVVGLGHDPRIGFGWLRPGPGWGGSCLPKDASGLLHTARDAGYEFDLVRCAIEVNERQHRYVVDKVRNAVDGELRGTPVALWGAAFKANTDDLRESPAIEVARALVAEGAEVVVFDPMARADDITARAAVAVADDMYAACDDARVLVVVTEWEQFARADLQLVAQRMAQPTIVDVRNVIDPKQARDAGFEYRGIGR
jgi:UDPglucose 6-dehydrogenase